MNRRPPDYVSPPSSLSDVPVERGRVGGMALGSSTFSHHSQFRPYFYRGAGEDTMEEELRQAALDAEREQMMAEAKAERRRLRLQAEAQAKYARLQEQIKRDAERIKASLVSKKPEPEPTWLAPVIPLFPKGPPVVEPEAPAPAPQPPPRKARVDHRPKGPSPGWKPLTGADLEGLLDD